MRNYEERFESTKQEVVNYIHSLYQKFFEKMENRVKVGLPVFSLLEEMERIDMNNVENYMSFRSDLPEIELDTIFQMAWVGREFGQKMSKALKPCYDGQEDETFEIREFITFLFDDYEEIQEDRVLCERM